MIKIVLLNLLLNQFTKVELKMENFMVKEKWPKPNQVTIMKEVIQMGWNMEKVS